MSGAMLLKPRIMDPRRRDDISEALVAAIAPLPVTGGMSTPAYMVNYYPAGLRERTLGAHSRGKVSVSRYYPTLTPKVVVDFEPAPPDPWYFEQKLQLLTEQGIIFIEIRLNERLTEEQFIARYKEARGRVEATQADAKSQEALKNATLVEDVLATPRFEALIDRIATNRANADRDRLNRRYAGSAYTGRLTRHKTELVDQFRGKLRNGVDPERCYRELTDEAERPSDG